jgi:RES domain-containing protein
MVLWRISKFASLAGLGAELSSGRWHRAAEGKRIVYLSEHPAVALLENLANLGAPSEILPDTFQLLKVSGSDAPSIDELTSAQRASIRPDELYFTQSIGDAWLASQSSALLRVPSIPSPESWNYLLNPHHPDAYNLRVQWARHITYDRRLFHLSR